MSQRTLHNYARAGLWALPIYGVANLLSTLSSQPDYHHNFPAYASYIHTTSFLASHLAGSLLGTGIGLLGFTALLVYLASSRSAGIPVTAYVTTILGNVALVAVFGVAAGNDPGPLRTPPNRLRALPRPRISRPVRSSDHSPCRRPDRPASR